MQRWATYLGDRESRPLCPQCPEHDARFFCGPCLRWFCSQHIGNHPCVRVPLLNYEAI